MTRTAIITGASSGLGKEIANAICENYFVYNWSIETGIDVRDETCIRKLAMPQITGDKIDVLINCAGISGIDYMPDLSMKKFDDVMNTNARGIFIVTKALLEKLRGGTVVNIISNASHVPMTASLAYNASKGAAEIMTRQMARELWPTHGITVFGVSPNRLGGTPMSRKTDVEVSNVRNWNMQETRERQKSAMLIGEETDPKAVAQFIAFLLKNKYNHKYLAGSILEYGI